MTLRLLGKQDFELIDNVIEFIKQSYDGIPLDNINENTFQGYAMGVVGVLGAQSLITMEQGYAILTGVGVYNA